MEGEEASEPALEQQLALALHRVPEAVEQLHQRLLPAVQVANLLDAPPSNRARKRRDELTIKSSRMAQKENSNPLSLRLNGIRFRLVSD